MMVWLWNGLLSLSTLAGLSAAVGFGLYVGVRLAADIWPMNTHITRNHLTIAIATENENKQP